MALATVRTLDAARPKVVEYKITVDRGLHLRVAPSGLKTWHVRRGRNYTRPMTRPGELAGAWRAAGFVDVQETTLCIRMEFASFDDYWAPYAGSNGPGAAYVATLNDAQRVALRDAVQAAYLDGEGDGPRSYAALAWAVRGTTPS